MITINMIRDHLKDCSLAFMPVCRTHRFRLLGLADAASTSSQEPAYDDDLIDALLFCGNPSSVAALLDRHPSAWALCIYGENERFELSTTIRDQVIFCRTASSFASVHARLQRLFFAMERWICSLKDALLQGGDYQSLLDCSESMLKNFISISNSEFRLIAHTKHIPIEDPLAQEVVSLGYHPPETIERFKKYHATKDWETQTRIELKPAELTTFPTLDYVFRMRGNYFLHVIMHCNNLPATPGLVDAFQLLIDHLEHCVKRSWNERSLLTNEPSRLFGDLISHRILRERDLAERSANSGIAQEGSFCLLALQFAEGSRENQLLSYYAQHAKEAFPWCFVGVYGMYVLVLDPSGALAERDASLLRSFADTHPCTIGISDPFGHLRDFAFAFQQGKNAIDLATSLRPSLAQRYDERPSSPLCRFSDSFAAYVVETARTSNHLIEHCVQNGIVVRIAKFDEQHKTNDLRLLYCFLKNERVVRTTCEELFLHRSTLLYRIERMQERFGFDLNDHNTRQRIMLEYLIHQAE